MSNNTIFCVNGEYDVGVKCAVCGARLTLESKAEGDFHEWILLAMPCEKCMDNAYNTGADDADKSNPYNPD